MALGTSQKFQIGGAVLFLVAGVYLYFAYTKGWPPFSPALKAKIQSILHPTPTPPTPPNPQTVGGVQVPMPPGVNMTDVLTPPAGTGQVPLNQDMLNPYIPKGDPTIQTVFQQEMYKQLFLPYDQYPYLYDQNYRQALVNPYDPATNPNDPTAVVFGYRPPIQGGDVPPNVTGDPAAKQQLYDYLAQNYGLYPPGGGGPQGLDTQYFTPGQGQGLPDNMTCLQDAQGTLWCASPSQTSLSCKNIQGTWYCPMNAPITDQTSDGTTTNQNPSADSLCYDYQGRTFCQSSTHTDPDCMNLENTYYCPTTPKPVDPNAPSMNCFVQSGQTYCQSPAQTSSACIQYGGKWYCPPAEDCFIDSGGTKMCIAVTPTDASCVNVGGKYYCPAPGQSQAAADDVTSPGPSGDPCFNNNGIPYCYSSTQTSSDCMSIAGYWYCPYRSVVTQQPSPTVTPPTPTTPAPANTSCAPQYCGSEGVWSYDYCRCVAAPTAPPVSTPAPTPAPVPAPTPAPPPPAPSSCNSSVCKSVYGGKCNTECQKSSSSDCINCKAICCNYGSQARAYDARIGDIREASIYARQQAAEYRELARQKMEEMRILRKQTKRPLQAYDRSQYSYDVIMA